MKLLCFHRQLFCYILFIIIHQRTALCKCEEGSRICESKNCTCSSDYTNVNCSYVGFSEVPDSLPLNVQVLNLTGNNIKNITKNHFINCRNLSVIDLSSNEIVHLSNGVFDVNGAPLELDLHDNQLELHENIFKETGNLTKLFVQTNANISHGAFEGLNELKELHIDGNLTDGFGASFSTLKNLETLGIYGKICRMANVTFAHLKSLTALEELFMIGTGLHDLEENAFGPFENLKTIEFSYNYDLNLTVVSRILRQLPKKEKLEKLFLTANLNYLYPTTNLDIKFFSLISQFKNLRHLKLDNNDLYEIPTKYSFYLRKLEKLDLSNNRLSCGQILHFLVFLQLKVFKCNHQIRKLKITKQNYVRRKHKGSQYSPCKFKFQGLEQWCFLCSKSLQELHLTNSMNDILTKLPETYVFGTFLVVNVKFRQNDLRLATGPIFIFNPNPKVPVNFDFSNNKITCLAPDLLSFSIGRGLYVATLNLEGNNLGDQLVDDKNGSPFANYSELRVLNIADNKLKKLHPRTFFNNSKLSTLNLSTNFLQLVEFDFKHMKNLKHLDLSDNLFVVLTQSVINALSSFNPESDGKNMTVHLYGNPFTCSCDTMYFMYWVMGHNWKIEDINKVTCLHQLKEEKVNNTKSIINELKMSCYSALPLKISGGLIALLIVCLLIGNIAYRYRWDIRYYLIKHSQKKKIYHLLMDQNAGYQFDAFVSYDTNDRHWIVRELIGHLENEAIVAFPTQQCHYGKRKKPRKDSMKTSNSSYTVISDDHLASLLTSPNEDQNDDEVTFKLCIHERDFEPGREIEANILTAIQRSKYVLLIVSNNFIKSKWCRLELEMAKMESLERGRNIAVIVFLEPIEETLESLEWLMKRYTYLEWFKCDTPRKIVEFWKKMKVVLGGKTMEKIVCECGSKLV